jgi:hypothetical protein
LDGCTRDRARQLRFHVPGAADKSRQAARRS